MKTILVPVDFNPHATAALQHAVELAKKCPARIVVLYADTFDAPAEFTSGQKQELLSALEQTRRKTREELERYARNIVPQDVEVSVVVREELPVPAILHTAEDNNADLIVMGTHGHGPIARLLLGSVSAGVKRSTQRPVVTVSAEGAAVTHQPA